MDFPSLILLSVGLAMDSFTVSICSGMTMNPVRLFYALRIAFLFGIFQALMPVAGWLGGTGLADLIGPYDHWIAFTLLAFIGGKMIREATQGAACERRIDPGSIGVLLVLSVATSIDALAVGLSLAFIKVDIVLPVIMIGAITAALSMAGVYLGRKCGSLFQSRVQTLGGLILIGIGVRIVIKHLTAYSGPILG